MSRDVARGALGEAVETRGTRARARSGLTRGIGRARESALDEAPNTRGVVA